MIYCEKSTAEYIGGNYSSSERPFTITYGWVAEITNVDEKHRESVQLASANDFKQIVQMIYGDEDIGKSYNKNELAEQLLQRSKEGYSRNYVIKKNDVVIAHACTNAEIDGVAIVAELIVNKEYRRRGYIRCISIDAVAHAATFMLHAEVLNLMSVLLQRLTQLKYVRL